MEQIPPAAAATVRRYMNHGLGFACLLARIFRYATERGLFEPVSFPFAFVPRQAGMEIEKE